MNQGKVAVNALDKIVAMLEAFLPEGHGLRLSELCELTGLSKSTASTLAHALIQRGYLRQDGPRGLYYLGVRFIEFGNVVQMNLHVGEVALPFLTELSEQINETVEIAVRDGGFAAVLGSVRSKRMLSASGTGPWAARVSLKNTACGKILAAFMDPREWKSIRGSVQLTGGTSKTITNQAQLDSQLEQVRATGVAIEDEEVELGICSIAAPVYEVSGQVSAALYIIGPKSRITDAVIPKYKELVKQYAERISQQMGHSPADSTQRPRHRRPSSQPQLSGPKRSVRSRS